MSHRQASGAPPSLAAGRWWRYAVAVTLRSSSAIGFDVLQSHVPRKENPRVLADFGDVGIHHVAAHGFAVNRGDMRLGHAFADHLQRFASIDEVINDQNALTIAHDLHI